MRVALRSSLSAPRKFLSSLLSICLGFSVEVSLNRPPLLPLARTATYLGGRGAWRTHRASRLRCHGWTIAMGDYRTCRPALSRSSSLKKADSPLSLRADAYRLPCDTAISSATRYRLVLPAFAGPLDLVAPARMEEMSCGPVVPPNMARACSSADPVPHSACSLSLFRRCSNLRIRLAMESRSATATRWCGMLLQGAVAESTLSMATSI